MTPSRTASKPLAARNAASSSPKPSCAGSYGGTFITWLRPCTMTTRPAPSVIQAPAWPSGADGCAIVASARALGAAAAAARARTAAARWAPRAATGDLGARRHRLESVGLGQLGVLLGQQLGQGHH